MSIGFLQNSNGEYSHTKAISVMVAACIMGGWIIVCFREGKLLPIDPSLIGLLALCMCGNGLNKSIELNSSNEKARFIRAIMERVKK